MKLKYKLFLSIITLGAISLSIGVFSYYLVNKSVLTKMKLQNNEENAVYISESVENELLELIRLTTTLASADVIKDSLEQSNEEFSSYTISERNDYIDDLNDTWMNTNDINDPFIKTRMENDVASYLISQQTSFPDLYGEIFLTNKYGVMISTTKKLTTLAHFEKYWWQGSFNDGEGLVYLDDRGFDTSVEGYVLGIVVPIYNDQGEIIGIIKSNYNISDILKNSVSKFQDLNNEGEYLIVRTLGLIVNGENIEPLSKSISEDIIPYLGERTDISSEMDIDDIKKFVAIAPIDITYSYDSVSFGGSYESIDHTGGNLGEGWSVLYLVDKQVALSELRHTIINVSLISFGILSLISIAALFVGELFSKPLKELNKYIEEVGKGGLVKKETKITKDEIGKLTISFNRLIDDLNLTLTSKEKLEKEILLKEKLENILIEKEKETKIILNLTAEGIYGVDLKENCIFVNQTFLSLLGYDNEEEVIGKNIHNLIHYKKTDGTDNPIQSCSMRKTLNDGNNYHNIDDVLWKKDGTPVPVVFTSRPKYKNKILEGAIVSFRNITEQKNSENIIKYEKYVAEMYLDIAGVMLMIIDNNGKISRINKKGCEILEATKDEIIGVSWLDNFILDKDKQEIENVFKNVFKNNTNILDSYENKIITFKGKEKVIFWNNTIVYGSNREITGILCSGEDVTERRQTEEILHISEKRYRELVNSINVGIVIRDIDTSITMVNEKATELLGSLSETLKGKKVTDHTWKFFKENGEILPLEENPVNLMISTRRQIKNLVVGLLMQHSDDLIWFSVSGIPIMDDNNNLKEIIISFIDITDLKLQEIQLNYEANNDFLTGLYNRRYYEENLKLLDIEENLPITIVMADINGLKLINDAFGHDSGDELLISAAKIMTETCDKNNLIARIGGDEFAIVMPNTAEKDAEMIIKKLHKKSKSINIESIQLSISFGYKTKTNISENLQDIYRTAEDLMYREKLLEIPSMRSGAIETILSTLYEKDENSEVHSRRVSLISEKFAKANNMSMQDVAEVKMAGLLHDIGKIITPISIINKKGKLTEEEYNTMKNHPEIGFRILNSTHEMREIADIVLNHHERWDGLGYPRGIKKEDIPLKSRIISIADAFDAMTGKRSYRKTISNEEALKEIIANKGTQFDPELVKVFEQHFTEII